MIRRTALALLVTMTGCAVETDEVPGTASDTSELSVSGGLNVARASRGATVAASSVAPGAPASALLDGDRRGLHWGNGGGWSDNTFQAYPDHVTVTFPSARLIDEIDVFSLQDNYTNPVEPIHGVTTFTAYGARNFSVAIWSGSSWVTVGSVVGNSYVWRKFVFAPVVTTKIRVNVTLGGANGWTQLTEVEAWTASPGACASYCGGIAVRSCDATCTTGGGITSTCGQQGYACVGGPALPSCSACTTSSSCFDHCSLNGVASTCESVACDRPKLRGEISFTYGADVNRCIEDPVTEVNTLPIVGTSRHFAYPDDFPRPVAWGDHWQSIVRLPANPDRFLVTMNQEDQPQFSGYLGIINAGTAQAEMMQKIDGTSPATNRFNHPGGAQALGTGYVFVAEEQQEGALNARIRIYPQQLLASGLSGVNPYSFELPTASTFGMPAYVPDRNGAAAVAVAKLRPLPGEILPRYLMLVASKNYSYRLYAWVSRPGMSLDWFDPGWEGGHFITLGDPGGHSYINGWGKQQNMNLLTDCLNGDLYLISWGDSDQKVRLHRIHYFFEFIGGESTLVGSIGPGTVAERDVACNGLSCDFGAGAGSYVDANHDLHVYATSKTYRINTTEFCTSCSAP